MNFNTIICEDARNLSSHIKEAIIDVTITSPPYYNMKDYGSPNQIGFNQTYENYLSDLKTVFKSVYDITKNDGSLWVILDTFKKKSEVVPLPFDFMNKMKEINWKLQEIIIWSKDRTVPWAHEGQMRSLFEYILVFSKDIKYKFYIDKIRDFENLKKWWVKYPERYNPKGKSPSEIWNFDIPTQGSWGEGYIRHFCPLPEKLIEQIISLTTNKNDIVLDPFAGSGSVLAKADNMSRKYIGFELNQNYIYMFENYIKKTGKLKKEEYEKSKSLLIKQKEFAIIIKKLRILKFARVLYNSIKDNYKNKIKCIYVTYNEIALPEKNKFIEGHYYILLKENIKIPDLTKNINTIISVPPLSKYGIKSHFYFDHDISGFVNHIQNKKVYTYSSKATHKYISELKNEIKIIEKSNSLILSNIKLSLNEQDMVDK